MLETSLDWDTQVTLPKFDAGLGTLQSVVLRISGDLSGLLGIENIGDKFDLVEGTLAGTLTVYDGLSQEMLSLSISSSEAQILADFDGQVDYSGPSGYTFTDLVASGFNTATFSLPGDDLAGYIGVGQLPFQITAVDGSLVTAGFGEPLYFSSLNGSALLQITYTYDSFEEPSAIPEPGALFGLGLASLALMSWRRLRRALAASFGGGNGP